MPATTASRDRSRSLVDHSLRKILDRTSGKPRTKFLRFLNEVRARCDLLKVGRHRKHTEADWLDVLLGGLLALSRSRRDWIRPVETWRPEGANPLPLFSSLAHHLTAEYPAPPVLLSAWFMRDDWEGLRSRRWFLQAARGVSLREVGFPVSLTRRMAHRLAHAPAHYPIGFALRWAQVRGLGGSDGLARAVAATRLGETFEHEDFWSSAIQFLVDHPGVDPTAVGSVVEYLQDQKYEWRSVLIGEGPEEVEVDVEAPQPNLSLKGWTADSLLRRVAAWKAERKANLKRVLIRWDRSSIGEFECEDDSGRSWSVRELLDSDKLASEGKAMEHCVATYTDPCARRLTTIWSIRVEASGSWMRSATVEVEPTSREVVQAKARDNEDPAPDCRAILMRWAEREALKLET